MNSRGEMELAIVLLALNHGLIKQEVFSSLVPMAIITPLVFPFVLQHEIKKNPEVLKNLIASNIHYNLQNFGSG